MIDENFYANLRKAARAELIDYANAAEWAVAQEWYVRRNKAAHESYEGVFARMLSEDPEMRAMDKMRRQARDVGKVGRPRKHKPDNVTVTEAESRLFEMAKSRAQRDGTSFEMAFVKVIDTPEGAPLYREIRDSRV